MIRWIGVPSVASNGPRWFWTLSNASSPYARRGALWDAWHQHHGRDGEGATKMLMSCVAAGVFLFV
jgi:hypothetical protein